MKISIPFLILILSLSFFCSPTASAASKKMKTRAKLYYEKQSDDTRVLSSQILVKTKQGYQPLVNVELNFYALTDTSKLLLSKSLTNADGKASLNISADYILPVLENYNYSFRVEYAGSDTLKKTGKEIEIQEAQLEVLYNNDTSLTVHLMIQDTLPVSEQEVTVYVERLYSLLPIGTGSTNEEGVFELSIPHDLPGDSIGTLNIYVKIEESDDFGTLVKTKKMKWGTLVSYDNNDEIRALWSDYTPLWMLLAVFVVLLGAWFNFFLAMFKLIKVKKIAKSELATE